MRATQVVGLVAVCAIWGCGGGAPDGRPAQIKGEVLGKEAVAELDAITPQPAGVEDVVLPNGKRLLDYARSRGIEIPRPSHASTNLDQPSSRNLRSSSEPRAPAGEPAGPQQRKNDIISTMMLWADVYANRELWYFPKTTDPGGGPEQKGLAYSYGSKDTDRHEPRAGTCKTSVHGLDCSGLVFRCASNAGLQIPVGTAETQSDPETWNKVIPVKWRLKMKRVTGSTYETGDIVSWVRHESNVHHIGIVESGGGVRVYQSHGSAGPETEACRLDRESPARGPAKKLLSEISGRPHFGEPTSHLRLVTTLSGKWDLFVRCAGKSVDAATLHVTLDNEKGGPFQTTGTGTDYDGSPLSFVLAGNYDQDKNIVDGTLTTTNANRIDSFKVKLLEDDTQYFAMSKVKDNGGCAVEGRLLRLKDDAVPAFPGRSASAKAWSDIRRANGSARAGSRPPRGTAFRP